MSHTDEGSKGQATTDMTFALLPKLASELRMAFRLKILAHRFEELHED
jgi:hypothetical protein